MHAPAFDPSRLVPFASRWPDLSHGLRDALRWGAHHTGLPVVLFAAIALVASWHVFRRTLRFAVQVVIAVAALLLATRLGWIAW
jgi:hypothetical protein